MVQEAFARALARPAGLTDIDAPEAWLRTVAVNVVRRRWRRRQLLDTILLRERPVHRLVADAPTPERTDLRDALATLPRSYREVVVLHYLADLPVDEIAGLLEVPVGTVKSRLSRARAALATSSTATRPRGPRRRWPMPDLTETAPHSAGRPAAPDRRARVGHGPVPGRRTIRRRRQGAARRCERARAHRGPRPGQRGAARDRRRRDGPGRHRPTDRVGARAVGVARRRVDHQRAGRAGAPPARGAGRRPVRRPPSGYALAADCPESGGACGIALAASTDGGHSWQDGAAPVDEASRPTSPGWSPWARPAWPCWG